MAVPSHSHLPSRLVRLSSAYLRWPAPLWFLTGRAPLRFGDHRFDVYLGQRNRWWTRVAFEGRWEVEVIAFLQRILRPGDVFLDVGAWIGPYTLLASRLVDPGGHVYAFEPDPVARRLLERNVKANRAANVTVVPYAASDSEGVAWLSFARLGNSGTGISRGEGGLEVETVRLDRFCERNRIHQSVVKIDVEGAEGSVVAGMSDRLATSKAIVLEFHERLLREKGTDPANLFRSLLRARERVIFLSRAWLHGPREDDPPPGTPLTETDAITGTVNLGLL